MRECRQGRQLKRPITPTDYDVLGAVGTRYRGTYPPLNRPRRAIVACPLRCAGVHYVCWRGYCRITNIPFPQREPLPWIIPLEAVASLTVASERAKGADQWPLIRVKKTVRSPLGPIAVFGSAIDTPAGEP